MAFSKQDKENMLAQYEQWLSNSQAVFMVEFNNLTMKEINTLRAKVREAGGEAHVVKNTLMDLALKNANFNYDGELQGTTLAGFANEDIPALAKVLGEVSDKSDLYSLKFGFMDKEQLSKEQIKILAELPPLPVMRAILLGTILAPATKLVRTIAEPSRMVAAVIKAFSEKEAAPA